MLAMGCSRKALLAHSFDSARPDSGGAGPPMRPEARPVPARAGGPAWLRQSASSAPRLALCAWSRAGADVESLTYALPFQQASFWVLAGHFLLLPQWQRATDYARQGLNELAASCGTALMEAPDSTPILAIRLAETSVAGPDSLGVLRIHPTLMIELR